MEKEAFLQVSGKFWKKWGGLIVSSRGASGGIGTLWDDKKFDLIESKHYLHWILTKLLHKDSNTQVSLFNIYVPFLYAEFKDCWNLLRDERRIGSLDNIILAGNVNVTLNQAEKRGGYLVIDPIREQDDELILDWELSDVILTRGWAHGMYLLELINFWYKTPFCCLDLTPLPKSFLLEDQITSQSF